MSSQPKKASPYGSIKFDSINAYHACFDGDVLERLNAMRKAIHEAAPEASETISYNMPAFKQGKTLVYYAAYKSHIGFYPTPSPIQAFAAELADYTSSKGAIQFAHNRPLPIGLIKAIVLYRCNEVGNKV